MYRICTSSSFAVALFRFAVLPLQIGQSISVEISDAGASRLSPVVPTEHKLVRRDVAAVPRGEEEEHGGLTDTGLEASTEATPQAARQATASRSSASERRSHPVVPGHVALPSMTELSDEVEEGAMIPTCVHVYEKARDVVVAYKAKRSAANPGDTSVQADGWVCKLEKKILAQKKGPEVEHEFGQVLDNEDLSDGFAYGRVWTSTDATVWAACNSKRALVHANGEDGMEGNKEIGGCNVEQGDEMPVPKDEALTSTLLEAAVKHRRAVQNLWPATSDKLHEVSYCFSHSISSAAKEAFESAVQHIEKQVPCLRFKLTTVAAGTNGFPNAEQENCQEFPSVLVQSSARGCWSFVGKISGEGRYTKASQPLNIGRHCEDLGIAAHELGHAIGLLHEMSREDRDKYVKVQQANIAPAMLNNFEHSRAADTGSTFDFTSLMMYGSYAFSTNGELTVKPEELKLVNYMGQRMGFSQLDIELIGSLYGCNDTVTPLTLDKRLAEAYVKDGTINTGFKGPCKDSTDTGFYGTGKRLLTCKNLRKHCSHDTLGKQIQKLCPVSCFLCVVGVDNPEAALPASNETAEAHHSEEMKQKGEKGGARSRGLFHGLIVAFALLILKASPGDVRL